MPADPLLWVYWETYLMPDFPSEKNSKIAIVIVTYNALDFVKICLDSVRRYSTMPHEIIVVDNASESPTRDYLKQQSDLRLILNEQNELWCAGCNRGIQAVSEDVSHILLLNSDMEVRRADWLQRMVNVLESSSRIGIIGTFPAPLRIWPLFGSVDGQCLMARKSLFDEIGLMNSEKYPWNGGDLDLTARAFKKGYIYKLLPSEPELVIHYRGMSRRRKKVQKVETHKNYDRLQAIRDAGLCAFRMPRFLWAIYKRLPGKPFYKLTSKEFRIARGKT